MKKFDVFISHASEDKKHLVRPLVDILQHYGAQVWYDEFALKPGTSLSRSIEKGLTDANFGLVVLSESFFRKSWTGFELQGLYSYDVTNPGILIPL